MKCAECSDRWKCGAGYDLRRKRRSCEKAKKPAKRSNADRIRSMSDEELAEWVQNTTGCPTWVDKNYKCPDSYAQNAPKKKGCLECWLEWLRQEAT